MESFILCYSYDIGFREDDVLQDLNSLPDLLYQRKFHVVGEHEVTKLMHVSYSCNLQID